VARIAAEFAVHPPFHDTRIRRPTIEEGLMHTALLKSMWLAAKGTWGLFSLRIGVPSPTWSSPTAPIGFADFFVDRLDQTLKKISERLHDVVISLAVCGSLLGNLLP
jgi:hypothetical protein